MKHIVLALSSLWINRAFKLFIISFCLILSENANGQEYKLIDKIPLSIQYTERFKFSISKLIDSSFYIFKTNNLTHTEIIQSKSDTLFAFNLRNKKLNKVYCKWPKDWIDNKSVIQDFYVYENKLYVNFDKSVFIFHINWEKQKIKLLEKVPVGYYEIINCVQGDKLYFSSIYDYDNSIKYYGPHIGKLDLKSKISEIILLEKKGIQFSHFPSKRTDFKYNMFLTSNVLDFKLKLFDENLSLIDSICLDSLFSNTVTNIYYDYTKEGLQTIKAQDKSLFRIIKVYIANANKIITIFKDSTCKNRTQYKMCTIERTDTISKWKISHISEIINENEYLASNNFIPWLNSSSLYTFIDDKIFYVSTKNININNGVLNESKAFCIYIFNITY